MLHFAELGAGRRAWLVAISVALAPLVVLAGCGGSALDPKEVQAANLALYGQGPGGTPVGVPGSAQTVAPGTVPGDPAASGVPGSTAKNAPSGASGPISGPNLPHATSCAGFKNQKGVTNSTITIGNTADISGPLPGLFVSAQQAVKAYVAYFNQKYSICGRKLVLKTYDSRTDAGANQQTYTSMCNEVFAAVGSLSVFDSGGARTAQACGLPDILASAITPARNSCSTCFGIQTSGQGEFNNATYDFWVRKDKAATQNAAFVYLNAGAATANAKVQINVGKKRGMNWVYTAPIDLAEFNYGPYVQQMKSKDVQFVQFIGGYQQAIRLLQAMKQAAFNPRIRFFDQSVYDQNFMKSGGSAINGVYFGITFIPFEEHQSELDLYKSWLNQVAPGATPAFAGLFAWSAAKLFVEEAVGLGGRLTRASLVAKTRTVSNWTGGGMHAPMSVGSKHTAACVRFMTVDNGRFVPFGGTKYQCNGISRG